MTRLLSILVMSAGIVTAAQAFDLQGHRGARGLAPENTLAGFTTALSIGVSTLELDLGMSKDGVLVVHHDEWLNPDTTRLDGKFLTARGPAIHALTLEQLKRYDVGRIRPGGSYAARFSGQRGTDGERIPALSEVFALVAKAGADQVRFNIETKITPTAAHDAPDPETFAAAVAKAMREAGLSSRVSVQSFDWRTLTALKRIAPEIERVCLTTEAGEDNIQRGRIGPSPWTAGLDIDEVGGSTPKLVAKAGCAVWSPDYRDLRRESVAEAKTLGLKVIPWTVNTAIDMERMIGFGVDGIITDYPDRLRAVMAKRNMELPKPVAATK